MEGTSDGVQIFFAKKERAGRIVPRVGWCEGGFELFMLTSVAVPPCATQGQGVIEHLPTWGAGGRGGGADGTRIWFSGMPLEAVPTECRTVCYYRKY